MIFYDGMIENRQTRFGVGIGYDPLVDSYILSGKIDLKGALIIGGEARIGFQIKLW